MTSSIKKVNWNRYTSFILLGLVVVEVIGGVVWAFSMAGRINENKTKINSLKETKQRHEKALEVLENLDGGKINQSLQQTSQALPSEKKVSGIISSLTSLATSANVTVSVLELTPCSISTRSAVIKKPKEKLADCENVKLQNEVSGVPLTMQLVGEENDVLNFLRKIEHVSPTLGVRRFDYSFTAKGKVADLSVLLYFQPVAQDIFKLEKISNLTASQEQVIQSVSGRSVILP